MLSIEQSNMRISDLYDELLVKTGYLKDLEEQNTLEAEKMCIRDRITAVWAVLAGAVIGIVYNTLWLERKNRKKEEEK